MSKKNQQSFGVKARLFFLTAVLLLGLVGLGLLGMRNSKNLSHDLNSVIEESIPVIRSLALIDMFHDGLRGVTLTAYLGATEKNLKRVSDAEAEHAEMEKNVHEQFALILSKNLEPEAKEKVERSYTEIKKYFATSQNVIKVAKSFSLSQLSEEYSKFETQFEVLEKELGELGEYYEKENAGKFTLAVQEAKSAQTKSTVLLLLTALLGVVIALYVSKQLVSSLLKITERVAGGAHAVGASVTELLAASENLASSSQQQAQAIQETSSAAEEISAMVNRSNELAKTAENRAIQSRSDAEHGGQILEKLTDAMRGIDQNNNTMAQVMSKGNDSLSSILKVIESVGTKTRVINDIVFQTKLLSFNASVEAARAGEHGKGFAVVAEEVGKLAEMSGNAAKEINALLNESIVTVNGVVKQTKESVDTSVRSGRETVDAGNQVVQNCAQVLRKIISSSAEVSEMVTSISTASNESAKGVQEILSALHQLDSATQMNANAARSCAESADALNEQVVRLRDVSSVLEKVVGGSSQHSGTPTRDGNQLGIDAKPQDGQPNRSGATYEKETA